MRRSNQERKRYDSDRISERGKKRKKDYCGIDKKIGGLSVTKGIRSKEKDTERESITEKTNDRMRTFEERNK